MAPLLIKRQLKGLASNNGDKGSGKNVLVLKLTMSKFVACIHVHKVLSHCKHYSRVIQVPRVPLLTKVSRKTKDWLDKKATLEMMKLNYLLRLD